jgi:hypothetical protein
MTHLVSVDAEAISGSARRDSLDSSSAFENGPQSHENLQLDEAVVISNRSSEDNCDSSDSQDVNYIPTNQHRSASHSGAAESEFVSISSIVASVGHDSALSKDVGHDAERTEAVANADLEVSSCDTDGVDDCQLVRIQESLQQATLSDETRNETQPAVVTDTTDDDEKNLSSDIESENSQHSAEANVDIRFCIYHLHHSICCSLYAHLFYFLTSWLEQRIQLPHSVDQVACSSKQVPRRF